MRSYSNTDYCFGTLKKRKNNTQCFQLKATLISKGENYTVTIRLQPSIVVCQAATLIPNYRAHILSVASGYLLHPTSAPDDRVLVASVDLLSKSEVNYIEVSVEKDVASTEVKSMTGAICRDAINKEQSLLHQCTCHPLR